MTDSGPDGGASRLTFSQRVLQARFALQARRGRRVTQSDVAAAVGVTPTTVARWERGEKEPPLDTIVKLAAALEVDPGALAFGSAEDRAQEAALAEKRRAAADQKIREIRERMAAEKKQKTKDAKTGTARRR